MDENDIVEDYKKFAFKGDMIKLAIAFILGGAFNKVVTSISENLLMPIIDFLILNTKDDWRNYIWNPVKGLEIELGQAFGAFIDFFLISIILFFLWVFLTGGDRKGKSLGVRIKELVMSSWFYPIVFVSGILMFLIFGAWTAGIWLIVLTMIVSWVNNRELRQKQKQQEEDLKHISSKIEEQ
jgi:large conductance mechanosensitive channel protein